MLPIGAGDSASTSRSRSVDPDHRGAGSCSGRQGTAVGPGDALAASGSSGRSRSRPPARDLIACVRRVVNRAPARPPEGAMRSGLHFPLKKDDPGVLGHLQSRELAAFGRSTRRQTSSLPVERLMQQSRQCRGCSCVCYSGARAGCRRTTVRSAPPDCCIAGRTAAVAVSDGEAGGFPVQNSRAVGHVTSGLPRGRLQKQHSPKSLWPTVAPRARARVGHRLAARRWLLRRDQGLDPAWVPIPASTAAFPKGSRPGTGSPLCRSRGRGPAKVVVYDRYLVIFERLLAIG